jgi:hypothetical protein
VCAKLRVLRPGRAGLAVAVTVPGAYVARSCAVPVRVGGAAPAHVMPLL